MAAAQSAPAPPRASSNEPKPQDAVLFVGMSLALGIASRHALRRTRVPYTVALLLLGTALGSLVLPIGRAVNFVYRPKKKA